MWDAMHAHVIVTLANINRDSERQPDAFELKDFLLFRDPEPKADDSATLSKVIFAALTMPRRKRRPEDDA